jgi:hypothetical protein
MPLLFDPFDSPYQPPEPKKRRTLFSLCLVTAVLVTVSLGTSACGSSHRDSEPTDEEFVSNLCRSGAELISALTAAANDPTLADSDEALAEALAVPFAKFARDFEHNAPPRSLQAWHDDAAVSLKRVADDMRDGGGIEALTEAPFPDPPAELRPRLQRLAQKDKLCRENNLTFGPS